MRSPWDLFSFKEAEEDSGHNTSYEKPEQVALSEELYDKYKSSRSAWEKEVEEDEAFVRGAQWDAEAAKSLKARNMDPIVNNVLEPAVDQAKALLTSNKPRFTSTAREDSDVKTGKVFADLMTHVWDRSDGNTQLKRAVEDYYVKGMGVLMAYPESFTDGHGNIKLIAPNPMDVFLDPNTKSPFGDDSPHILVSKVMLHEQIQGVLPDVTELLKDAEEATDDYIATDRHSEYEEDTRPQETPDKRYRVIERYSKIKVVEHTIVDPFGGYERKVPDDQLPDFLKEPGVILTPSEGEERYVFEPDEVEFYQRLGKEGGGFFHFEVDMETGAQLPAPGEEGPESVPGSTVKVTETTIGYIVDNGGLQKTEYYTDGIYKVTSIGGVLYEEGIMPISNYPIVTIMNHHKRDPYPMSDIRMAKGLQEHINKIESLIIAHASNSTNVKVLLPRGTADKSKLEQEFGKAGTAILEYNAEIGQPIVVQPLPLPNELYKNKQDKIQEVERLLGIYALMQGDAGQAPSTYKGTVALDEYGQRRIRSKRDDIESALNKLARVVVELIQRTYTKHRAFRIVQPNDNPDTSFSINEPIYNDYGQVVKRLNDVTVGKYDLVVVAGSTLPSSRWALAEYYMELAEKGLIDQQEFLIKSEVADVEGVLKRSGKMAQMERMIEQLQQELKKVSGDNQTLLRESIHDKKQLEVMKFKTQLAEASLGARKASQLYENLLQNEFSMQKERLETERKLAVKPSNGEVKK